MKRSTAILTTMCTIVLTAAAIPASAKDAAGPKSRYTGEKIKIAGRNVLDILKMLGAKRGDGVSDKQLNAYISHFNRSDPNKDGKHSKKEYIENGGFMTPQARRGIFGAADSNADGVVTRVEYVMNRIITDEAKGIVQRTDADRNGKIARAEFVSNSPLKDKALAGAVFDALDSNSDGATTIPEYLRVWGKWARPNYKDQEAKIVARLAKLGNSPKPAGRKPDHKRKKFTKPCAANPKAVKDGYNLVVNSIGIEVPPQGRPFQEGYRLIQVAGKIEDHNRRAYAKVFTIMAPIRNALMFRLDKTTPDRWKKLTAVLTRNDIKTKQSLKGPTPRDNYYSSEGIFRRLKGTYAGKIPAGTHGVNAYSNADYHAMMKYLDEAELQLKGRTFSADFDFTNPEGKNPFPKPGKGLIE
ncbi:MAG: hypothetical protein QGH60_00925 [Phycisphaerae bacterium]|jgi:hypothetical protein|nr:hypothetical protein [Phycisphaerae bacterium]